METAGKMESGKGVVGFVGLDELSLEIASLLIRSGFLVQAYEVCEPIMDDFLKLGGAQCGSAMEAAKDAASTFVFVSDTDQVENIFFGKEGVLRGLHGDAVVILRSTISPVHIQKLQKCLVEVGTTLIVDAHVFKGVSKSFDGKIVAIVSGKQEAISKAQPFLSAMSEKLYIFHGEVGVGSKVRMVIELLEGIHLVASVEGMFLGAQAGLHPWILYDIISNAAGSSWRWRGTTPV